MFSKTTAKQTVYDYGSSKDLTTSLFGTINISVDALTKEVENRVRISQGIDNKEFEAKVEVLVGFESLSMGFRI